MQRGLGGFRRERLHQEGKREKGKGKKEKGKGVIVKLASGYILFILSRCLIQS
jgi:hypothetical protein